MSWIGRISYKGEHTVTLMYNCIRGGLVLPHRSRGHVVTGLPRSSALESEKIIARPLGHQRYTREDRVRSRAIHDLLRLRCDRTGSSPCHNPARFHCSSLTVIHLLFSYFFLHLDFLWMAPTLLDLATAASHTGICSGTIAHVHSPRIDRGPRRRSLELSFFFSSASLIRAPSPYSPSLPFHSLAIMLTIANPSMRNGKAAEERSLSFRDPRRQKAMVLERAHVSQ